MLENIKKEINCKIVDLQKIKGLKKHNDAWELQKLILTYQMLILTLNTSSDINIEKICTYLKTLKDKFEYFTNTKLLTS